MKYLIVFTLCIIATSKVTLQSLFSKNSIKNFTDVLLFNGTIFFAAAVIFFRHIPGCSAGSLFYGSLFGILSVVFQVSYTKALSTGAVSLTVMIVNLSMVIPVIVSATVYNESVTICRIISLVLTCLVFVLGVDMGEIGKLRHWIFPALCAFSANGGISVVQKMFGKTEYVTDKMAFVSFSYVVAAVVTLIIYLIVNKKEKITFSLNIRFFALSIGIGIILAVFQVFNTYAISVIDGTFLFPAYSGGSIICSSICGIVFFKDKLNLKQKASLILGAIAIILMNF